VRRHDPVSTVGAVPDEPRSDAQLAHAPPQHTHPSDLDQAVIDKVVARRGRLHAFETLDPERTALVVIDLNAGSVRLDPACLDLVGPVNALAAALRAAGGTVAWVTPRLDHARRERLAKVAGADRAAMFYDDSQPGADAAELWPGLVTLDGDLFATKPGASAFFPGSSSLHDQLRSAGIESVLIAGTVTNVCCESSARDATELGYEVTMVSDACAGHARGLHEASLTTFFRSFGDVRPTADVLALIDAAATRTHENRS